jgi:uncharacterized membrane protein (GlpM family)
LLLVSIAVRRWGPSLGGWLAGLPLVAGPTLFFITIEQGAGFGARASSAALLAMSAVLCFGVVYAHAAQRMAWPLSLCVALLAWGAATLCLSAVPVPVLLALLVALLALAAAPRLFPAVPAQHVVHTDSNIELYCRMLAGALVTVTVTWVAGTVGENWSGLLAVFPTLGTVLAVFSHRAHGGAYVAELFRAMVTGLYSFAAFCFSLSLGLSHLGIAAAFIVATSVSVAVQLASKRHLQPATGGRSVA